MSKPKSQESEQPVVESPADPAQEPQTQRAIDLARAAGMLPETTPGPRLRPATENPKAWLYRAAKLRFRMGDEDQITEQEFNQRVDAIRNVLVR